MSIFWEVRFSGTSSTGSSVLDIREVPTILYSWEWLDHVYVHDSALRLRRQVRQGVETVDSVKHNSVVCQQRQAIMTGFSQQRHNLFVFTALSTSNKFLQDVSRIVSIITTE